MDYHGNLESRSYSTLPEAPNTPSIRGGVTNRYAHHCHLRIAPYSPNRCEPRSSKTTFRKEHSEARFVFHRAVVSPIVFQNSFGKLFWPQQ